MTEEFTKLVENNVPLQTIPQVKVMPAEELVDIQHQGLKYRLTDVYRQVVRVILP